MRLLNRQRKRPTVTEARIELHDLAVVQRPLAGNLRNAAEPIVGRAYRESVQKLEIGRR